VAERRVEKCRRGLASVDAAKRREIARKGGQAAQARGTAHQFTSAEARAAGRKGGAARGKSRARGANSRGAATPRNST
jgi:general stress protein YciG